MLRAGTSVASDDERTVETYCLLAEQEEAERSRRRLVRVSLVFLVVLFDLGWWMREVQGLFSGSWVWFSGVCSLLLLLQVHVSGCFVTKMCIDWYFVSHGSCISFTVEVYYVDHYTRRIEQRVYELFST